MTEIIPAVLEGTLADMRGQLMRVRGAARSVQIDVVDGALAPNKTWPFAKSGQREEFEKMVSEENGLPLWKDLNFEADLMVAQPASIAMQWVAAGASRVVLHAASEGALETAQSLQEARTGMFDALIGLALLPSAQAEDTVPFDGLIDFVQVMGIEHVGFQGEQFDERAFDLVDELRERRPTLPLQVDGGVKLENVRMLAKAGASRLIVGSAIFGSDDPRAAYERLLNEART